MRAVCRSNAIGVTVELLNENETLCRSTLLGLLALLTDGFLGSKKYSFFFVTAFWYIVIQADWLSDNLRRAEVLQCL